MSVLVQVLLHIRADGCGRHSARHDCAWHVHKSSETYLKLALLFLGNCAEAVMGVAVSGIAGSCSLRH
jgi:hypothetical protein